MFIAPILLLYNANKGLFYSILFLTLYSRHVDV